MTAFVSIEPGAYRADAILAEVGAKCREVALRDYGIEVIDVQLRSFDFPKQNRPPLYARMKSERGRISMKYRSEGEEEGLKVRAAADQEKSRILSEALKLAQQHRGEGEGKAARIYAEALAQGPEFYQFVRTHGGLAQPRPQGNHAGAAGGLRAVRPALRQQPLRPRANGATRKVTHKRRKE